jgi:hypothetical protein
MPGRLRQLLLFVPPLLVSAVNLTHPMVAPPVYVAVLHHLEWWLWLHIVNLALFPLFGLSAYLLLDGVHNGAAAVSRLAIAVFVPVYAAFDALTGIGTGTLVQLAQNLPPDQAAFATQFVNAFYDSATLYTIAAAGSIAWVIAMLSAAVAFTTPERRRLVAVMALIVFPIGGWARTNLFLAPDGMTITPAWWMVTIGIGLAMFLAAKPRATGTLLPLSGALFGAQHVPPTGPLGAACFCCAAWYVEFVLRGNQSVEVAARREIARR